MESLSLYLLHIPSLSWFISPNSLSVSSAISITSNSIWKAWSFFLTFKWLLQSLQLENTSNQSSAALHIIISFRVGFKSWVVAALASRWTNVHWKTHEYIIFTHSSSLFRLLLWFRSNNKEQQHQTDKTMTCRSSVFVPLCSRVLLSQSLVSQGCQRPSVRQTRSTINPTSKQTNKRHNQEWNLKSCHTRWLKCRQKNSRSQVLLLLMSLSGSKTVQG